MANQNDSFIDEVTEDLRRDRLFAAMRRYGWVVLALILMVVAGAGWREYSRSQAEAQARAFGDALLAAEAAADPAKALAEVPTGGDAGRAALTAMMAADALLAAGDRAGATARLDTLGADKAAPAELRDLARLKALALKDTALDPAERDAALAELSVAGAPYRLLALEQKAIALIEAGRRDDAVALIRQIQQEQGLSENLRRRLADMLTTLDVVEEPEAAAPAASAAAPTTEAAAPAASAAATGAGPAPVTPAAAPVAPAASAPAAVQTDAAAPAAPAPSAPAPASPADAPSGAAASAPTSASNPAAPEAAPNPSAPAQPAAPAAN